MRTSGDKVTGVANIGKSEDDEAVESVDAEGVDAEGVDAEGVDAENNGGIENNSTEAPAEGAAGGNDNTEE